MHAICNNPIYGLVVDRMNMELKGGMGLRPPSPPFSSSSSSLSSFGGKGSVLAFLLTGSTREIKQSGEDETKMKEEVDDNRRTTTHIPSALTLQYGISGWKNGHV